MEAEAATAVGTAQPTWLPLLPSLSPALLRLTLATAGYGYCLVEIFGVLSCGIVSHTGCAQYLCRDTCFDLLMLNYIRFPKPICLKYWKRYWTWRPGIGPTLASRTSPWSSLGLSFLTVGGFRLVEPSKVVTVWKVPHCPSCPGIWIRPGNNSSDAVPSSWDPGRPSSLPFALAWWDERFLSLLCVLEPLAPAGSID